MSSISTEQKLKTNDLANGFNKTDFFEGSNTPASNKRNLDFSPPDSVHSRLNWVKSNFATLQKEIIAQPNAEQHGKLSHICEVLQQLCEKNIYQVMGELYLSDSRHYASIKPLYITASLYELINRYNQFHSEQPFSEQKRDYLLQAALLHNLGLLNSKLYNNQQELTDEERHKIRHDYPKASLQLAEKIGIKEADTLETIEQHNMDSDDPHLGAHLLRMPFVYAGIAMRERRQYEVMDIINPTREFARLFAANKLDPILGGLFLKINGLAPVGSIVQFDSREKALVLSGPDEHNIASSKLRMIANSGGVQLGWPGKTFRLDTTQLKQKGMTNHHEFAWNKFAPFAAWEK